MGAVAEDLREGLTGNSKTLGREQRSDLLHGELGQRALQDLRGGKVLFLAILGSSADLLQDLHREPGLLLIVMGDTVNSCDSVLIPALGDEELGRFVQLEKEESTHPEHHGDGTKGKNKVSPAHVVFLGAVARVGARVVGNESPGQHTGNEGTH